MVERCSEVVSLLVEDVQPTTLLGTAKIGRFDKLQEIPSVAVCGASPVVPEQLECVFANRLEHPEPRPIRGRHPLHHAVGDEALERAQVAAGDVGCGFE